jgi:hypothetical protein
MQLDAGRSSLLIYKITYHHYLIYNMFKAYSNFSQAYFHVN